MELFPQNREEWKWFIIIAVSFFLFNFLLIWAQFMIDYSLATTSLLFALLGLIIGVVSNMKKERCFYISIGGGGLVGILLTLMFYPLVVFLFFEVLFFTFCAILGTAMREHYLG